MTARRHLHLVPPLDEPPDEPVLDPARRHPSWVEPAESPPDPGSAA